VPLTVRNRVVVVGMDSRASCRDPVGGPGHHTLSQEVEEGALAVV
jgi:hypothetical protein